MNRLIQDIDFAHRRRWPGRPLSWAARGWLLASSPSLRLLLIHRIAHWLQASVCPRGWRAWLRRLMKISLVLPKWACQVSAKSEISRDFAIDGGVSFSDQGYIIFAARRTGTGTVIGPRVTFGKSHVDNGVPEIGRNVWIGSDCVVYGAIRIGDGATLLPGTVLTKSIPAGVVMQGNPARLVLRSFDNSPLRESAEADAVQSVEAVRKYHEVAARIYSPPRRPALVEEPFVVREAHHEQQALS
jgi:serine acetyltransferase